MENRKNLNLRHWPVVICMLALTAVSGGCLKNDKLNLEFDSIKPAEIGDGLTLSTLKAEAMDSAAITGIYRDIYRDDNLWSLRSMLIFRNGKLVAESYLKDKQDIINRHLIWSCTKQFMGVLTGIALENGVIGNLYDPISKYLDSELASHQDKKDITIRDLITMRSGINFNNEGLGGNTDKMLRQIPDNSVSYILNLPMNAIQGEVFHYNDGNPHLMSAIIQKRTGRATDVWADEVLFSKIELTNYNWVRYRDGITLGAFGIETTPREMAKLALCVAANGKWKGEQVVDPEWISQMTHPQAWDPLSQLSFGYFWWIDTARNICFMDGHGGQYAFIVPAKNLVVVMTSFPNTQDDYQIRANEALPIVDRIVAAAN